jgi:isopentenyldiphosphate isomerase
MNEEILDLVNEKDEIVGTMSRTEVFRKDIHNVRVINCFIKNSKGELWVPMRHSNKTNWPDSLGISCGGFVTSGENYDDAFKREMLEELNIDITKVTYTVLGKADPKNDAIGAFSKVYEIIQDTAPNYNKEDFQSYEWILPSDLAQKIKAGQKSQTDLLPLVTKFYL